MSEYWVSKDKYYCKYCKIYIADDKPSRNLHETGLKHKGNLDRFIRDIYKKGESNKREAAEEAREIARMNAAAGVAMTIDGSAEASTSTLPAIKKVIPRASTSSDPFANYSTAESMGFVDEVGEVEKAALVSQKAEGNIGQWETVAKVKIITVPIGDREVAAIKLEEEEKEREEEEKRALEDKEREDRLLEKPNHHKYFHVKTVAVEEEEIGYDPSKMGIKLKRQRLTLREEELIKEEEDLKIAIKKEQRAAERGKGGWNQVEIEVEPVLQFEVDVKEEIKEETIEKEEIPVVVEVKSAFKKRKGNSAQRMKS